jgi:tetratricopeptide (TPR) repeat protein
MIRTLLLTVAIVLVAPSAVAWADAPTAAELEAAKKAFADGNAAYKAGKFGEAFDKLRESYRLSHNAVLLYNIGFIQEQAGHEDQALFYYRKFLAEAPANAPKRDDAKTRVDALEKENVVAAADPDAPVAPTAAPPPPAAPRVEIEHQLVESAPFGLPIDITAVVPADANLTLTVFYRTSGEASFTKLAMFAHKQELVARIPAARVAGRQVQYYLEARDAAGALVTRMGRGTAPNLINLEVRAKPRYDATMNDDGTDAPVAAPVRQPVAAAIPVAPPPPGEGRPFPITTAKWISTGVAGALLGTAIVSFTIAGIQHDKLVTDSESCGVPPCREFDVDHDQKLQALGERYDTVYKVTLIAGVVVAGVAGYFWYRDLTKRRREDKVTVTPAIGDQFAGVAAMGRF